MNGKVWGIAAVDGVGIYYSTGVESGPLVLIRSGEQIVISIKSIKNAPKALVFRTLRFIALKRCFDACASLLPKFLAPQYLPSYLLA